MIVNDDRLFLVTSDKKITSIFIDKLVTSLTPTSKKRIFIISDNSHAYYYTLIYALNQKGYSEYVEHKTQYAIKIFENWIHIIKSSEFSNIRGYTVTDMYIQDYDSISDYNKEILLKLIPVYNPKILWIWGNKLNDVYINPIIKNGYKNYLLGNPNGMKFLSEFEESSEELMKRIHGKEG